MKESDVPFPPAFRPGVWSTLDARGAARLREEAEIEEAVRSRISRGPTPSISQISQKTLANHENPWFFIENHGFLIYF